MKILISTGVILASLLGGSLAQAQSLKGSSNSINKQYRAALSYGYTFVETASKLQAAVKPGQLVKVNPDRHMELVAVSYPYAVPGTKLFLNRLSAQYHNACGEKLTVTSLLRPKAKQPVNSVARSVHPTGMAVDMRVPRNPKCRSWLEKTLLALEKERVLDVTRERRPPHYHVAVFVEEYETRVAVLTGTARSYSVRRGDTLSQIAARHGVKVAQVKTANGLNGSLIKVGQKLHIPPATRNAPSTAGTSEVVASNEITHRVNRGDTLWQIAKSYGTSVQNLRRANGHSGDFLQVGQLLKISKG